MDKNIVEEAGLEFFGIPSGKLRRYFSLRTVADCFRIIAGFFKARKILKKEKPRLLFSKGGFVSVPPCAAAASLGIPVFTHESDFSPGLATRLNARYVSRTKGKIFTAYEDTARFFKEKYRSHVTVSGNPVRSVFHNADPAKGRAFLGVGEDARILLVLGGSQGARDINSLVRACLQGLTENYTVVHQTGSNQQWDLPCTDRYKHYPYIKEELPHVMAAAEIIMGRSGAGIWEWAVLGKPMLLIPLKGSGTRGDQVENARFFQEAGAAQVLTDEDAAPGSLLRAINTLALNHQKRMIMAGASLKIGNREGTNFIARELAGETIRLREKKE
jgi:UDP-N-acetylglucosamine--N-acetylmuramyl-(pentapeptide) pyrophosphoryl-undecaprenol N-acetylglucosamine transferase